AAGVVGAAAAGAAGVADYLEIPNDTETKQVANAHAVLNVGLLGLSAANLLLRREDREPGPVGLILSLMGTAGLAVSAWYGGQLVFEHGVRVRNAQPLERAPEARIPGSEQVERALLRAEGTMPRRGPTDRRAESDERMAVEARY